MGVCYGNDQVWTVKPHDKGRGLPRAGGPCGGCGPPRKRRLLTRSDKEEPAPAKPHRAAFLEEGWAPRMPPPLPMSRAEDYLRTWWGSPAARTVQVWRRDEAQDAEAAMEVLVPPQPRGRCKAPRHGDVHCAVWRLRSPDAIVEPTRGLLHDHWRGVRWCEAAHTGPGAKSGREEKALGNQSRMSEEGEAQRQSSEVLLCERSAEFSSRFHRWPVA